MRYPIPGTEGWYIDKDKRFWKNDLECDLGVQNEIVKIKMYDIDRILDINWLLNVAIFGIDLPLNLAHKLFTHVSFTRCINKRAGWPYLPSFDTPIYIGESKEYRIISAFSRYAINRFGTVIEVFTLKEIPHTYDDYVHCNIYDNRIRKKNSIGLHRLLCFAWIRNENPEHAFFINHKDGNKHNFELKNLEWITPKENAIHAMKTGLRNDNVPHKLRDVYRGEILNFHSCSAAYAYVFSVAGKEVDVRSSYSNRNKNNLRVSKLLENRFEIRSNDDDRPWYYEELREPVKASQYLIDITYPDGSTNRYHGTMGFIRDFKIWNPGTCEIYHVVNIARNKYPDHTFVITNQYDQRPVERKRLSDGSIVKYATIIEHSKEISVHKTTVLRAVNSNGTKEVSGYLFRRETEDPWPTEYTSFEKIAFRTKAINKNTKEEILFDSIRDASKFLKMDRQAVTRHIERPKTSDEFLISYLEKS